MKKPNLESHNIEELWTGKSLDLLKELHIVTREGKINQDSRRKLKQVYHLCQLIAPYIEALYQKNNHPMIVDVGCGKSYLGFLLYDLILREKEFGEIIGIDFRSDLQERSTQLAHKSNFQRMRFMTSKMEDLLINSELNPNLVCALHACDTATDDAIFYGIQKQSHAIIVVPCCQAEVARLLDKIEDSSHINYLWDYPIHRREFGSHLTNVIRCLCLRAKGYKVTVTELVGWEHSMKNEIILAEKTQSRNKNAEDVLQSLLKTIPIEPKLVKLLKNTN